MFLLGPKLKAARKAKGLRQEDVARMIGVSRTAYTKYETEAASPSYDVLHLLCQALEISPNYLLDYDENAEG